MQSLIFQSNLQMNNYSIISRGRSHRQGIICNQSGKLVGRRLTTATRISSEIRPQEKDRLAKVKELFQPSTIKIELHFCLWLDSERQTTTFSFNVL